MIGACCCTAKCCNARNKRKEKAKDKNEEQDFGNGRTQDGYTRIPGPSFNRRPEREVSVPLVERTDSTTYLKADVDDLGQYPMTNHHQLPYANGGAGPSPQQQPTTTYPPQAAQDPYTTGYYTEYTNDSDPALPMSTYTGVGAGGAAVGSPGYMPNQPPYGHGGGILPPLPTQQEQYGQQAPHDYTRQGGYETYMPQQSTYSGYDQGQVQYGTAVGGGDYCEP